jgi:hypothetical protein
MIMQSQFWVPAGPILALGSHEHSRTSDLQNHLRCRRCRDRTNGQCSPRVNSPVRRPREAPRSEAKGQGPGGLRGTRVLPPAPPSPSEGKNPELSFLYLEG